MIKITGPSEPNRRTTRRIAQHVGVLFSVCVTGMLCARATPPPSLPPSEVLQRWAHPSVSTLSFKGAKRVDDSLRNASPRNIYVVDASQSDITDAGVNSLPRFQNLGSINLSHTNITDACSHGFAIPNVVALDLSWTKITDAALPAFANCPKLHTLLLEGTQISKCNMPELHNLENLDLNWCPVTNEAVEKLGSWTWLKMLGLHHTKLTDEGITFLSGLENLTNLDLGQTNVTSASIGCLLPLKKLESLNISGTWTTDDSVPQLKQLKNLKELDLRNTHLTKAGIDKLRETLPHCNIKTSESPPGL